MRASGFSGLLNALFSPNSFGAMAKPKPTVLPDPVSAETTRSFSLSSGAITTSCTEVKVL